MSRLTLGRPLRQRLHRRLVTVDPSAPPVAVYADAAGNRIDPRQHGLVRAISGAYTVNSQPGFLQQVFCLPSVPDWLLKNLSKEGVSPETRTGGASGSACG